MRDRETERQRDRETETKEGLTKRAKMGPPKEEEEEESQVVLAVLPAVRGPAKGR